MGNVAASVWGLCGDSAEQAEEAKMEGADTVAVETEQPRTSGSPTLEAHGAGKAESGAADKMTEAALVTVAGGRESSVDGDDTPLVDLKSAAPAGSNVNEVKEETQEASACKELNESVPAEKAVEEPKVDDQKKAEGHVKTETTKAIETVTDVEEDDSSPIQEDDTKPQVEAAGNVPKADDIDKLSKLAQHIDDFTDLLKPSQSANVVTEDGLNFDDEALIEGLIKEVEEDKGIVSDANVDTVKPENGHAVCEGKAEGADREVTPEISNGSNVTEGDGEDEDAVDLSNAESNGVNEKTSPNGSMSVSTESEGFQDDKGEAEPVEEETVELIQPETKPVEKKAVSQKVESPTKSVKSKKKEDKGIDHILKALSSLHSTEEKLAALCKKYADLHEDHRILQASFKQSQRKVTVVTREKDQLQTEHTKAVMAKSKLESLCRELQKHNQTIRQESLQRAKEEDDKRKEISQKFQTTIGEIQTQMQENHERNKQLREENFELANKLKKFIEQYEVREKQVEKVIQHRELEQKLADAKLEQASAILLEEKARNQKERELLVIQATEYMKKMQLKDAELTMYKERYEEFQTTIKRSEEMFSKFKSEMDKMSKRCKKVEKEGANWKSKWDNANRALLAMAEEKTKYDKERPLLVGKIQKLESLCRAMQAERTARNILETEGVDLSKLSLTPDTTSSSPKPTEPCPLPTDPAPTLGAGLEEGAESGAGIAEGAESGSTGDECKIDEDEGSDLSSASEETGVTVIQQGPEESSQSEPPAQNDLKQSEETTQDSANQSEAAS